MVPCLYTEAVFMKRPYSPRNVFAYSLIGCNTCKVSTLYYSLVWGLWDTRKTNRLKSFQEKMLNEGYTS